MKLNIIKEKSWKRLDALILPKDLLFYLLQSLIFAFSPSHVFALESNIVPQNVSFLAWHSKIRLRLTEPTLPSTLAVTAVTVNVVCWCWHCRWSISSARSIMDYVVHITYLEHMVCVVPVELFLKGIHLSFLLKRPQFYFWIN